METKQNNVSMKQMVRRLAERQRWDMMRARFQNNGQTPDELAQRPRFQTGVDNYGTPEPKFVRVR